MRMANRDASIIGMSVRSVRGHCANGPSWVFDQSMLRISSPHSPPPAKHASASSLIELTPRPLAPHKPYPLSKPVHNRFSRTLLRLAAHRRELPRVARIRVL